MIRSVVMALTAVAAVSSVPASAQVTANKIVVSGDVRGGFPTETQRPSNSTTVNGFTSGPVTSSSFAVGTSGFNSFASSTTGFVDLTSAGSGSMFFNANTQTFAFGGAGAAARAISSTAYYFTLTGQSVFSSIFNVITTGTPAGHFQLNTLDANGNVTTVRQQSGLTGTGNFNYALGPGKYFLGWSNDVNNTFSRSSGNTFFDQDSGSGILRFNITAAVPEPGAWLLMIVGFGIVGAGLRADRKRRPLATA